MDRKRKLPESERGKNKLGEIAEVTKASSGEEEVVAPKEFAEKVRKVAEKVECEKCGTMLTARALTHAHGKVCSTPTTTDADKVVVDEARVPAPNYRMQRIQRRQDKFDTLFAGSV